MTREEMLKKSGLTDDEFKDLVKKFKEFLDRLSYPQRAAVDRWLPSAERIAASFGPALTIEELARYVGAPGAPTTEIPQSGIGLGVPPPPVPPQGEE